MSWSSSAGHLLQPRSSELPARKPRRSRAERRGTSALLGETDWPSLDGGAREIRPTGECTARRRALHSAACHHLSLLCSHSGALQPLYPFGSQTRQEALRLRADVWPSHENANIYSRPPPSHCKLTRRLAINYEGRQRMAHQVGVLRAASSSRRGQSKQWTRERERDGRVSGLNSSIFFASPPKLQQQQQERLNDHFALVFCENTFATATDRLSGECTM